MSGEGVALLLDDVARHVRRYVVLSHDQAYAVALWVAHTHTLEAADTTPYLSITSAEKESGKTLLLEVLRPLVARPWFTGRVTPAVLARKVDAELPTLLLDESDAAFKGPEDYTETLRGSLNTGYCRGGAVSVCVGQGANLSYKDFSTFCPKAIAGLGKLPDTVASRSIPIRLRRRAPAEEIERHRSRDVLPAAERIAHELITWARDTAILAELRFARPELPDELSDRAADVWEPLFAIADLAGEGDRAREAAVALSAPGDPDEETLGVRLLADCREAFDHQEHLPTRDLLDHLCKIEEAPWGDLYGKPLSPRKLSTLLRRYEIKVTTIRVEERTPKGYRRTDFEDAWSRYLPQDGGAKRNIRNNGSNKPETATFNPQHGPPLLRIENPEKPHEQANVADVADWVGGNEDSAPAKPGSAEFMQDFRDAGGRL